jgi:predicted permease
MASLFQDLAYAARCLRKRPGFLIAAVAIVAIGIGANITVFTIVNALLLRPLPFGDRSDRIVTLHATHRMQPEDWGWGDSELSYPDLVDFRGARALEGLAGYFPRNFTLSGGDAAERVQGGSVTPDLFATLGVEPMLGRPFLAEEAAPPGLESSVILTHGLWQRRYGADPTLIGRTIVVNDRARTVVGVMPPGFKFPERDEIYLPLRWDEAPRAARNVNGVGLLASGVTLTQAQAELDAIAGRLAAAHPDSNRGFGIKVLAFRESQIGRDERASSLALMGSVGLILLIVCANLANLLLVRSAARQRELALRAAMGASRGRIVSNLLAEGAVLSMAGTALGLLAAQWALDAIRRSFPEELPYWLRFDIDGRVAAFAAVAAVFTTVAVGLLPAFRAVRLDLMDDLKDSGRGVSLGPTAQRVQGGLAIVQVALSLALLVGANLMIRSFLSLQRADLGFDHHAVLSARAYLAGDAFDEVRSRAVFFVRAAEALRNLPGVQAAAATTSIPGDDGGGAVRLVVDGRSRDEEVPASAIGVTAGLVETFGLAFLEGRGFSDTEVTDPDARVAMINASLADRLWPGESVVDRRIGFRGTNGVNWFRIIGVVPDVHYEEPGEATDLSRLNVYVPYASSGSRTMAFLVRADAAPAALTGAMRDALHRLNANMPLYEVMPLADRRRFTTWEQEFFGDTMGVFAGIALMLACLGVYALLAYVARRRSHEIGVRLALGAEPRDVAWLFLGQAGRIGGAGLVLGLVLAAGVARALRGSLFGVEAFDPWLFAGAGSALVVVVLLAAGLPARQAARTDPMAALRSE